MFMLILYNIERCHDDEVHEYAKCIQTIGALCQCHVITMHCSITILVSLSGGEKACQFTAGNIRCNRE